MASRPETVDARDVLDPDARVKRPFRGRIVGRFERTGPNAWDPYRYVAEDGGGIDVLPGLRVKLDPPGTTVRLRARGRVVRVAWLPEDGDRQALAAGGGGDEGDAAAYFVQTYLDPFRNKAGEGVAAWVARTLSRR